jgi:hypothetical protein
MRGSHLAEWMRGSGAPQGLSVLNGQLGGRKSALYGEPWRKSVAALLSLRNDLRHGRDEEMRREEVAWVLGGVEMALRRLREPRWSRSAGSSGSVLCRRSLEPGRRCLCAYPDAGGASIA